MSRPLLAILILLLTSVPAFALDADLKTPYQIQVVVHFAPNRFLTPILQDQMQREIRDRLRLHFGKLAQVEVGREHTLWAEIETHGLELALDAWQPPSDRQIFFLLVDFQVGEYRLQMRRAEGSTGMASPSVRHAETTDSNSLTSLALGLIEQDFSIVGTVQIEEKEIHLAIRGGGLSVPLDRWVRVGSVFALSRVTGEASRPRNARLPWAVLEVVEAPREGRVRCRFWSKQERLHMGPGVLGYRALSLPTIRGPLKLRLLDDGTDRPLDGVRLQVGSPGSTTKIELATNRDGMASSREDFSQLALVQIVAGEGNRNPFPVAILDTRPVVCPVTLSSEGETLLSLEHRRDTWLRRLYDDLALAGERVTELNGLLKTSLDQALERGQQGLKHIDEEIQVLTTERDELRKLARDKKASRLDLREGDLRLAELGQRRNDLQKFVANGNESKSASEETRRLAKLLERARLLESEADFEQALQLYDQVLLVSPQESQVRKHLDALRLAWTPRDDKHRQARDFIYQTWPTLDLLGLKANMTQATDALNTCLAGGDRLTPRKLLLVDARHASKLQQQLESLRNQTSEDSRNQARLLAEVADGLRRLHLTASEK